MNNNRVSSVFYGEAVEWLADYGTGSGYDITREFLELAGDVAVIGALFRVSGKQVAEDVLMLRKQRKQK